MVSYLQPLTGLSKASLEANGIPLEQVSLVRLFLLLHLFLLRLFLLLRLLHLLRLFLLLRFLRLLRLLCLFYYYTANAYSYHYASHG